MRRRDALVGLSLAMSGSLLRPDKALALPVSAFAAPAVRRVPTTGGEAVLPMSGLWISLPPGVGRRWEINGRWTIERNGDYDGRDVLDQLDADDRLAASTWVMAGDYGSGDIARLARVPGLRLQWNGAVTLHELAWTARVGTYNLGGDLRERPAVSLAAQAEPGGPLLVMLHLFVGDEVLSREEVMARLGGAPEVKAVADAFRSGRTRVTRPLDDPTVIAPDSLPMDLALVSEGLTFPRPKDGFVWAAGSGAYSRFQQRRGPALPAVAVEAAWALTNSTQSAFESVAGEPKPALPPRNVPAGWAVGPMVLRSDGVDERTFAKPVQDRVLLLGVCGPQDLDYALLGPMFESLAAGGEQARKAAIESAARAAREDEAKAARR